MTMEVIKGLMALTFTKCKNQNLNRTLPCKGYNKTTAIDIHNLPLSTLGNFSLIRTPLLVMTKELCKFLIFLNHI
jgi:hypothetical protein